MRIAIAGNPNSGKTTLFNNLTGATQKVGNWPGVTVEKKSGFLKGNKEIEIVDLPGIYSLSPYTLEEVIARNYLLKEKVDVLVNIIDGTNLERNLYLTTQLLELGVPTILAVNKIDLVEKNEDVIDTKSLGKILNVQVLEISAAKNLGISELVEAAKDLTNKENVYKPVIWFNEKTEKLLDTFSKKLKVPENLKRWYSIKLLEQDEESLKNLNLDPKYLNEVKDKALAFEIEIEDDAESFITMGRYTAIKRIVAKVYKENKIRKERISDRIDKIVTNKWLALPIFAVVIFIVYYLSISTIGDIMTGWVNDELFGESGIPAIVGGWIENWAPWLQGLILDGIIGGVGAVLGFLPQMLVLFILLGLLEESGYMARIAFILDRMFRKFGLSGKSFIPMLISTGCAIPGVMAARTIEDERDRKMTVMTTSFMPCGAKLPIIALIAGALFSGSAVQWLIAPSAYFIGIGAVVISGIMLKKTKTFAGDPAPFIMELPDYQLPRLSNLFHQVWNKLKSFVVKAGTIVLASAIIIWFLSAFNWQFQMVDEINDSILSSIGKFIAVLFQPLGWGDWKAAVATFTGLVAKENVVGTFGVLYGFAEVGESGSEIWTLLAQDFTALSGYSFLIFNLICAPCFAAIGAIRREMGSAKWTWFAVIYQTLLAYALALIVFQVGSIFTGVFNFGSVVGLITLGVLIYFLFRKNKFATPLNQ